MLCSGFLMIVVVTHRGFGCCRAVLAQSQGCFCRDCPRHVVSCSVIKAGAKEEGGMFRAMVFVSPDVPSRHRAV